MRRIAQPLTVYDTPAAPQIAMQATMTSRQAGLASRLQRPAMLLPCRPAAARPFASLNPRPLAAARRPALPQRAARQAVQVRAAAAGAVPGQPAPAAPAATEQVGVKIVPALISIAVGLLVRFVVPVPEGITMQAWTLFSIFLSTIVGELPGRWCVGPRWDWAAGGCRGVAGGLVDCARSTLGPAAPRALRRDQGHAGGSSGKGRAG
jgi:hypothetical protein